MRSRVTLLMSLAVVLSVGGAATIDRPDVRAEEPEESQGLDIGFETGTPVGDGYEMTFRFTGS